MTKYFFFALHPPFQFFHLLDPDHSLKIRKLGIKAHRIVVIYPGFRTAEITYFKYLVIIILIISDQSPSLTCSNNLWSTERKNCQYLRGSPKCFP